MTPVSPSRLLDEKSREGFATNRGIFAAAGILAVATLVAYSNSFSGPFIFDDITSIPYNPSIRHLWPVGNVLFPSHQDVATVNGRPLINLTFALNYAISGTSVWSYHVVNLLIQILCGITMLGVVRRTFLQPALHDRFGRAALLLAFVVALLWTLHPLQTESVTYITQRCESLMGLFYLLSLYGLIRGTEPGGHPRWLAVSVITCFLGTATKEVMITAPLMMLLYDRTFIAGSFGKAMKERRAYYVGLACSWLFTAWMMSRAGTRADTVGYVPGLTPSLYLLNQVHAIMHYLRLALWPYPQVFDYGPPEITHLGQLWLDGPILLLLLAGTIFALRRAPTRAQPWPAVGFLGCWFFLILAPSSSFVPIKDVMVEHRIYLSLAAVIALVVTGAYSWWGQRGLAILALVAPVYIGLTVLRNNDYRSSIDVWSDVAAKRPLNPRAHSNLAFALAAAGATNEALDHYREAVRLDPKDSKVHSNLGGLLVQLGRVDEAMTEYQIALELDPNNGAAHTNRGVILSQAGHTEDAMAEFEQALKCDHQDAEAHNNLGVVMAGLGRMPEAVQQYRDAVELNPDYIDAHSNLGAALGGLGKLSEAAEQYREVLRIDPQNAEAHYGLGVALTALGRIPEAIAQYEEALKINPQYEHARNNLAWLRARSEPAKN